MSSSGQMRSAKRHSEATGGHEMTKIQMKPEGHLSLSLQQEKLCKERILQEYFACVATRTLIMDKAIASKNS